MAKNIKVPETPLKAYEMENHFKLYLLDPGLLSTLCGLGPADFFNNNIHTFKGAISENFVASTFVANNLPLHYRESGAIFQVYEHKKGGHTSIKKAPPRTPIDAVTACATAIGRAEHIYTTPATVCNVCLRKLGESYTDNTSETLL